MSKLESDQQFHSLGSDAYHWLEKAEGLWYVVRILRDRYSTLVHTEPPAERRVETLGLFDSIRLIMGCALENLIKGVYIARNPAQVDRQKLSPSWPGARGGHGIAEQARELMRGGGSPTFDSNELDLLTRLEEAVYWAGRYPIPNLSRTYHSAREPRNLHTLRGADFDTADRLFAKLKASLEAARIPPP